MSINRQKLIDPFIRLDLLKTYMSRFIDLYPYKYSFGEFIRKYYPHVIPDTPEYYKELATHCYYCNCKLVNGATNFDHPKRSSIDHYQPRSKGKTDRYVICCAECNTKKGNIEPNYLVSKITKTHLKGQTMWGFHGNKLKFIADQIQTITNDMLYNTGPRIYYFKR